MATLTLQQLKDKGVCAKQVALFETTFGQQVDVSPRLCIEVAPLFDFDWAACNLLSAQARAEYGRARAPARAEYGRITALAWAEHTRAAAQAGDEYGRAVAQAGDEYERVTAPAWDEYLRVTAQTFGELYTGEF